jgi:hypothetical protein
MVLQEYNLAGVLDFVALVVLAEGAKATTASPALSTRAQEV